MRYRLKIVLELDPQAAADAEGRDAEWVAEQEASLASDAAALAHLIGDDGLPPGMTVAGISVRPIP